MTRPPVIAEWLVRASCPRRDRRFVLAELEAEYELRGRPARWYWRQALRSIGALIAMGARRGDWEYGLFAVMLATAGPAIVMEAWWSFVLSHVPLKATAVRGADFAAVSLAVTAIVSLGAGAICTTRGLVWALPAAWAFAVLGQGAVHNIAPSWMGLATLAAVTVTLIAGAWLRRAFEERV
jgi:hypothetical protein